MWESRFLFLCADGRERYTGNEEETEGRAGKVEGQPAHTREVKFGCVFTQTAWDEGRYPIRDPGFHTYTGAIESAAEFGNRIYLELEPRLEPCGEESGDRRWSRMDLEQCRPALPGAVQILDLFSCAPAIFGMWRGCFPRRYAAPEAVILRQQPKLDEAKSKSWLVRCAPSSLTAPL